MPDSVRGPDWVRVPATFVPRGGGRLTPSGQPWPRDRNVQEWPKDRLGRPVCPLWDLYPGVRAPGEGVPGADDPVAALMATDAVFRDPAAAAGLVQTAADGGRDGRVGADDSSPGRPAAPAQHGNRPVDDGSAGPGGLLDRGPQLAGSGTGGRRSLDDPIQQEPLAPPPGTAPPPPGSPPPPPPPMNDSDTWPGELLPFKQPGFVPGTKDVPNFDTHGLIQDPSMEKAPPEADPPQPPYREASARASTPSS